MGLYISGIFYLYVNDLVVVLGEREMIILVFNIFRGMVWKRVLMD